MEFHRFFGPRGRERGSFDWLRASKPAACGLFFQARKASLARPWLTVSWSITPNSSTCPNACNVQVPNDKTSSGLFLTHETSHGHFLSTSFQRVSGTTLRGHPFIRRSRYVETYARVGEKSELSLSNRVPYKFPNCLCTSS